MEPQKPTRDQLQMVFKDHRLVIAFESLFNATAVTLPTEIINLTNYISSLGINSGLDGEDGEDGISIVGPQGPKGDPGVSIPGMDGQDADDPVMWLPSASDYSATYSPSLTNTTNITSSSVGVAFYTKNATQVLFDMAITIDPTAIGEFELGISLPIPSNFTGTTNATGIGSSNVGAIGAITAMQLGSIRADSTNDRLIFYGYAGDATGRSWKITGRYLIM